MAGCVSRIGLAALALSTAIGLLAWAFFTAAPALAHNAHSSSRTAASATPTLSIAPTTPVLIQSGAHSWTTTFLVTESGAAITGVAAAHVAYELVPLVPGGATVHGTVVSCSPGTAPHCPLSLNQATRIEVQFTDVRLSGPLVQAALIVGEPPTASPATAPAFAPAEAQLTVQAPALSIAPTTPALVQTGAHSWTTTVLVSDSGAAITGAASAELAYELVPMVPDDAVVRGTVVGCSRGTAPHCALLLNQATQIRVQFSNVHLSGPLTQAALVVQQPSTSSTTAAAFAPAEIVLAVQRQVTPEYDLVAPLAVGIALAILAIWLIVVQVGRISLPSTGTIKVTRALVRSAIGADLKVAPLTINAIRGWKIKVSSASVGTADAFADAVPKTARRGYTYIHQPVEIQPPGPEWDQATPFRREHIYASASWSFKDSWATNITVVGGAFGSILSATGAASTVFPGVQLDRFGILMALFAFLTLLAPLVLGIVLPRSDFADVVRATGTSLLAGAFVTLIGVGGEIGAASSLIMLSSATALERGFLLVIPLATFVIVTWYACRTTVELVAHSRFTGQHSSGLSAGKDSSITL